MTSDSRQAIRAARAAMNDAIARRDPEAIARFFLPSYHVVTARNLHRHGPQDSAKSWAEMFARDRDCITTHAPVPDAIDVNEQWGMAAEHGRWTGTVMANDGPIYVSGVYAAKWQNTPDGWLLQAEIYTPLEIAREAL